ncbi:hypothetical protein OG552_10065 [Streptomyces sp. NBC_01476]|uniref:hypothetical protein n=1 Tax=Streptomyces sp. NBC_01476 TaxID=2903881 RepID=UPI002E2F9971|nr:hypothetical protein [Streptomyces sp. NBC_01476]
MVTGEPFGLPHFQLVLLRRMADHQPGLVDDALRELGASHTDMREANRRWQARLHSRTFPGGERRYRTALGPPRSERRQRVGDLVCTALLWPVPLWPDLRFEVLVAPGGKAILNEWLVRAADAPAPALRTAGDLTPWSCTVEDAANAFPPATPLPPDAPTRAVVALTTPGTPGRTIAHFTWGLLQFTAPESPQNPQNPKHPQNPEKR